MLYQMIVGAWPLQLDGGDDAGRKEFVERLAGWQQKALREAKLRTDWTAPNAEYEATARNFLTSLFEPQYGFLPLAQDFIAQIAAPGAVNGLSQAVLKMTVPGMPDFFQGTEFWDFSLVDPDNRRPVDYQARRTALSAGVEARHLLDTWRDGRVKQAVIRDVLALRKDLEDLFARGRYQPLTVHGSQADRIIAFARCTAAAAVIVAVPRHLEAQLQTRDNLNLDPAALHDSFITLPPELRGRPMQSIFDGNDVVFAQTELRLDVLLSDFPLSILRAVDSA
jgi:(1->4)-alpha-D-glucan 1-alpha-D-glucosylmutase